MKISEIRAFLAVAEAGSMHGAAARLNLTQPAVSRLVQRLEAELGAVLLDRSSKPPTLTPAGQQALAQGRRVLQALDDFSGSVAEGGEPRGSFRLGVSLGLSQLVLNEPLDGLRRKFPGLVLQVSSDWSGDLVKDVESNVMNAAVVLSPDHGEPASGAPKKKVGTDRLMVVAPIALALPPRASLAELAPHGWVLHPEGCSYRSALRRALAQAGAPFTVAVEAFDQELQLSLVARGNGLGLVPSCLLRHSAYHNRLRCIEVADLDYRLAVWIVRSRFIGSLAPVVEALETAIQHMLAASDHAEFA
ncbi:MAG: LysR family transcriptional regulator [Kiloniellaceae bacterium]